MAAKVRLFLFSCQLELGKETSPQGFSSTWVQSLDNIWKFQLITQTVLGRCNSRWHWAWNKPDRGYQIVLHSKGVFTFSQHEFFVAARRETKSQEEHRPHISSLVCVHPVYEKGSGSMCFFCFARSRSVRFHSHVYYQLYVHCRSLTGSDIIRRPCNDSSLVTAPYKLFYYYYYYYYYHFLMNAPVVGELRWLRKLWRFKGSMLNLLPHNV